MRGIVTVLNTPFTESDEIDFGGLAKHVRYALDAGVAGFLYPALASEVGSLSEQERCDAVRYVVEAVAGRVPVIGGAGAATQERRTRLAKDLVSLGCSGLLVNIPFEDEDSFQHDLAELAGLGADFVMLQDWDPHGSGLPVPLIAQLFESIPALTWLKIEVVPAGPKYTQVLEATGGRLNVAGGWAVTQMIEGLDRGVHAFMPTGMHRTYVQICKLYREGDRAGAQALFERILPVLAFSNQRLDVSIQFFKRLLHAQGIYSTPGVRPPTQALDAVQEKIATELIARVIALEGEV